MYKRTRHWQERAAKVIPGGAQTMSKRPGRFPGAFPGFLERGKWAYVFDIDGNKYLDFILGLGAVTLGYNPPGPYLSEELGIDWHDDPEFLMPTSSLPSTLEVIAAEYLVDMIPCAEQVRFVKTGSEACEAAVRIARRTTNKHIILVPEDGYHGWHSWFQVIKPWSPGIPNGYREGIDTFIFGDLESVKKKCLQYRPQTHNQVAAILLEPTLFNLAPGNFLRDLRLFCLEQNILLIFDEMVTGFRWAIAGGQEYFSILPDLAVFGKGMANGWPLACVVGPGNYMKFADVVSGTFGGERFSLAACIDTLIEYRTGNPIQKMWDLGTLFQYGFNVLAGAHCPHAACVGYPVHPKIEFCGNNEEARLSMSLFLQLTAEQGVLFHPQGFNISAAMTPDDIAASAHFIHHPGSG